MWQITTETALHKVKTDIMKAMNNQEVMCLVLFGLSAAFDIVSHDLLLNRLKMRFGIVGNALSWLQSYLRGRIQCRKLGQRMSS